MSDEAERAMQAELKTKADSERPWKAMAAMSFLALMLVVGLPLWWQTTTTTRHPLPYHLIRKASVRTLQLPLRLQVVVQDGSQKKVAQNLLQELTQMFQAAELRFHPRLNPNLIVSYPIKFFTEEERRIIKAGGGLDRVAQALDKEMDSPESGLRLVFLPASYRHPQGHYSLFFGHRRNLYVTEEDEKVLAKIIYSALSEVMFSRSDVLEIAGRKLKEGGRKRADSLWSVGSLAPAHALHLYAIHPQPSLCTPPRHWNLGSWAERRLWHTLRPLQTISNLSLSTRHLYTLDWARRPTYSPELQGYVLKESDLPHLINPMEAFISSGEPSKSVLNLLLYLTPPEISPLYIVNGEGERVEGNAFAVSSWGGVVVVNGCGEEIPSEVELALLGILRRLLGLSSGVGVGGRAGKPVGVGSLGGVVTEWELERLGLKMAVEGGLGVGATLASLTNLLDQIHNIVIEEEVAESVDEGVRELSEALDLLEAGESLSQALPHLKRAMESSDAAFHHQSLLQLLYFPDDQKYAIYVPLFLPIGLPVLLSLSALKDYFKGKSSHDSKLKTD